MGVELKTGGVSEGPWGNRLEQLLREAGAKDLKELVAKTIAKKNRGKPK